MTITLYTGTLVDAIKRTSELDVSEIADVEARYRAQAGGDKDDAIRDCLRSARVMLERRCLRFLNNCYVEVADNEEREGTAYVFEFDLGPGRRADGKADALATEMNNFIVEYALAKFYSTVSQGELSNKHSLLALEAGKEIDELLYTKLPPRV